MLFHTVLCTSTACVTQKPTVVSKMGLTWFYKSTMCCYLKSGLTPPQLSAEISNRPRGMKPITLGYSSMLKVGIKGCGKDAEIEVNPAYF